MIHASELDLYFLQRALAGGLAIPCACPSVCLHVCLSVSLDEDDDP